MSNAWPESPPRSNDINGVTEDDMSALFVIIICVSLSYLCWLVSSVVCTSSLVTQLVSRRLSWSYLNTFLAVTRRQICPRRSPVASIKQQYNVFTDWICRMFTVYKEPLHLICIFMATKSAWITSGERLQSWLNIEKVNAGLKHKYALTFSIINQNHDL